MALCESTSTSSLHQDSCGAGGEGKPETLRCQACLSAKHDELQVAGQEEEGRIAHCTCLCLPSPAARLPVIRVRCGGDGAQ